MEFSPEDILGYKWLLGKVTADFGYCQQAKTFCFTHMACDILPNGGIPNHRSDDYFDPGIGRSNVFVI